MTDPVVDVEVTDEGYEKIPLQLIEANPNNPRPSYQLRDDDAQLRDLAESIRMEGQHIPGSVYTLSIPSASGAKYRLLMGESRWRACHLAGLKTFKAFIRPAPTNAIEELTLLGVEEAYKRPWGLFSSLRHQARIAEGMGIPLNHPDMAVRSSLSMDQLLLGKKVFSLCIEIQALVAEGEMAGYSEGCGTPLAAATSVKTKELTIPKAALVADIFNALRANFTQAVSDYSDVDLQVILCQWATHGSSLRDLSGFLGNLSNPSKGMVTQIKDMLENPTKRRVSTFNRRHRSEEAMNLVQLAGAMEKMDVKIRGLQRKPDQLGRDRAALERIRSTVLSHALTCSQLAETIERSIRSLN